MIDKPHWMTRAPAMLRNLEGPFDEPCPTHFDRRWLWRLESFLLVNGTTDTHREMHRDLIEYLHETCEHVWDHSHDYDDRGIRQCIWCNTVEVDT